MKTIFAMLLSVISTITFAQDVSMCDLMRSSNRMSEPEYTEEQAFEKAAVVVRGYIDSVTEGRSVLRPGLGPNAIPLETALFKIEVTEVLKGEVDGRYVYFEFIRGGMPAEFYDDVKYQGELMLYLIEPTWTIGANIRNSPRGLMREVNRLYMLHSQDLFYALNDKPDAIRKPMRPIPTPDWVPRDEQGRVHADSAEGARATSRPMPGAQYPPAGTQPAPLPGSR